MPHIEAFRALRYDLGHVGSLSDVVAPPYDVIDTDLQTELYKKHPANVVRLILNRPEPGDDELNNRYSRAARFLNNWQNEGVLQRDPDPAIYVYHQEFKYLGQQWTRQGFMTRVRLEPFGTGQIYPHEETMPGPKADRLELMKACRANLSQVFGLYPDDQNEAQEILQQAIAGVIPVEATDHLGVVHRLWPVTDVKTISDLAAMMTDKPMFIADGHHRYETACAYRDHLAEQEDLPPDHPAHFVLMMCVSMSDPGMIVLPTHRLFRDAPELTSDGLRERLGTAFHVTPAGKGPEAARQVWQQIERENAQELLGLFTRPDQQWSFVRLTEQGQEELAAIASDHSPQWQALGVSILHRLLVETKLGVASGEKPRYVHLVDEVIDGLTREADQFPLAALVMPATVDDIRTISRQGERMPAKSTYFYPKLLSGLVINPLW